MPPSGIGRARAQTVPGVDGERTPMVRACSTLPLASSFCSQKSPPFGERTGGSESALCQLISSPSALPKSMKPPSSVSSTATASSCSGPP